MRRIRVVLADDHMVVLVGLKTLLGVERDVDVQAVAIDGEEALEAVRRHDPDVLVADLQMPRMDGLAVLRTLRQEQRATRVVVMGAVMTDEEVMLALKLGARGILSKDRAASELMACLRVVAAGGHWLEGAPALAAQAEARTLHMSEEVGRVLTRREEQLAACVAKGMRNAEIAQQLGISEGTVKIHLNRIYKKMGVTSRVGLTNALGKKS